MHRFPKTIAYEFMKSFYHQALTSQLKITFGGNNVRGQMRKFSVGTLQFSFRLQLACITYTVPQFLLQIPTFSPFFSSQFRSFLGDSFSFLLDCSFLFFYSVHVSFVVGDMLFGNLPPELSHFSLTVSNSLVVKDWLKILTNNQVLSYISPTVLNRLLTRQ